jgi:uncharacterized membrane protein
VADDQEPEPVSPDPYQTSHSLERLIFFSDAVIAIAMTLLALDIPLPSGTTDAQKWHSMGQLLRHEYFAFALSFLVISVFWMSHHRFFALIARSDRRLVHLNLLFLFAIVVLPYATRLIAAPGNFEGAVILYATATALVGGSLVLIIGHAVRHDLLRSETLVPRAYAAMRDIGTPTLCFLPSIPLAFYSTSVAEYSWLVIPVVVAWLRRAIERWRRT